MCKFCEYESLKPDLLCMCVSLHYAQDMDKSFGRSGKKTGSKCVHPIVWVWMLNGDIFATHSIMCIVTKERERVGQRNEKNEKGVE